MKGNPKKQAYSRCCTIYWPLNGHTQPWRLRNQPIHASCMDPFSLGTCAAPLLRGHSFSWETKTCKHAYIFHHHGWIAALHILALKAKTTISDKIVMLCWKKCPWANTKNISEHASLRMLHIHEDAADILGRMNIESGYSRFAEEYCINHR